MLLTLNHRIKEYQQEMLQGFAMSRHIHAGLTAALGGSDSEILSKSDFPEVTSEEGLQLLTLRLQRRHTYFEVEFGVVCFLLH